MKNGMSKVADPAGRVLHDRGTSAKPSPPTGVGNERKPDVRGTQEGGSAAEAAGIGPGKSHLSHATAELHAQHPHHHSMGGVHHTTDHIRHLPMHGLGVESRHQHSGKMAAGASHAHPEHRSHEMK
jgi:hypothetical protein